MGTGPLSQIMIYIYIRDEEPVPPSHYYTTIFSNTLNVTILANVDINVMLDTNSGSVSNSIAYMVVVAAVGIAEIIMSTVPISGSTLTIHTNKAAIIGAFIIFNIQEMMTNWLFRFIQECVPC